ncbi:MAG: 3'-5' exonuclease domain-containing protein 2 [Paludibacteraceae bacterium]|nr:3'-5' exonuclease domain-containing protein 2 [Paludibacteraceae bacterium]
MYQRKITKEEIDQLDPILFSGEIVLIDKQEDVAPAVEELMQSEVIGIDTETRPSFKKGMQHTVALLQVATLSKCFLFRINKIGVMNEIAEIFSDKRVKKIGLALKDDLLGLMRLHRFQARNCIDVQDMVNEYGIVDLGLQKIFAIIFQRKISKSQRLTNWENEQLTEQQCAYAATDAWATLLIYEQLMRSEKLTKQEVIRLKAEELALQIAAANKARAEQEMQQQHRSKPIYTEHD